MPTGPYRVLLLLFDVGFVFLRFICESLEPLARGLVRASVLLLPLGHLPEAGAECSPTVSVPDAPLAICGTVFRASNHLQLRRVSWSFPPHIPSPSSAIMPLVGDYNGDGKDDVLFGPQPSGEWLLGHSDGRGAFEAASWSGPPALTEVAAAGDFTGDGCSDLLFRSQPPGTHVVAVSDGVEAFRVSTSLAPRVLRHFRAAWSGDRDGDGFDDITLESPDEHALETYYGDPLGRFERWAEEPATPNLPVIAAADLEGVGAVQLLAQVAGKPDWLTIKRPAKGGFILWATFPWSEPDAPPLVADFNGDGRADVLSRGPGLFGTWAALSNGETALERPEPLLPLPDSAEGYAIRSGDFNGDGVQDLLLLGITDDFLLLSEPGIPVAAAEVVAGVSSARSDSAGHFRLEAPARGRVRVQARAKEGGPWQASRVLRPGGGTRGGVNLVLPPEEAPAAVGEAIRLSGEPRGPHVCLGYTTETKWGRVMNSPCPAGYALYELDDARELGSGTCCRLPAPDVLLEEHVFVQDQCPEGFVATGLLLTQLVDRPSCPGCAQHLRCTRVNARRYALSAPTAGRYWGEGFSLRGYGNSFGRSEFPEALRAGLGRIGYGKWDSDGCLGQPWGALLTRACHGACGECRFSALLHAPKPGEAAGRPVPMFPACRRLLNEFDPTAGCEPGQ